MSKWLMDRAALPPMQRVNADIKNRLIVQHLKPRKIRHRMIVPRIAMALIMAIMVVVGWFTGGKK